MTEPQVLIGIDVGGTFTDVIAVDPVQGRIVAAFKVPSTPDDPATAVVEALKRLGSECSLSGALVCHGTTVGTNTLIERKGARVALLATEGFTDVIELRRQDRPTLYHLAVRISEPLVPAGRRFGVAERMDARGRPVTPLHDVDALVARVRAAGVDAVAISCLHAYANSAHEAELETALRVALPGCFITASHDVCSEFREYERTSTTVVNAYIGPTVGKYIHRLEREAREMGIASLMIVKSNGGLTSPGNAQRYPVHLIESGPAAGIVAAAAYARATGRGSLIAFDMGGTTAKAGLIQNYQPRVTDEFRADSLVEGRDVGGYPIRSAVLDIVEVGAGGGSIAWIDSGGVPKVGPRSAGADPGPACYDKGGVLPTVTDAHAVIGTLDEATFEGTGIRFSRARAIAAISDNIARPMGWSVAKAAHAIVDIAVANMTEMVRLASVRRGYDPREFTILASGGAGPLHAAVVGMEVGVRDVVVPPYPGIFSALGAMLGEVRHDLTSTILQPLSALSPQALSEAFAGLIQRVEDLLRAEPAVKGHAVFHRFADLRFRGQLATLRIPLVARDGVLPDQRGIEHGFRQAYREEFGFDLADSDVELVNIHVTANLPLSVSGNALFTTRQTEVGTCRAYRQRTYLSASGEERVLPVYRTADCVGASLGGPAVIDHAGSTVWVPEGVAASVGLDGSVVFNMDRAS